MSTYTEIYDLKTDSVLRNKIAVAAVIKAQKFIDGATPTADELNWANNTLRSPVGEADKLINYLLAANNTSTKTTIIGATDSSIQTNVDKAVDALVGGGVV